MHLEVSYLKRNALYNVTSLEQHKINIDWRYKYTFSVIARSFCYRPSFHRYRPSLLPPLLSVANTSKQPNTVTIFYLSRAMIRNFQIVDYTSGLPGYILFLALLFQTSTCRNSRTSLVSGEIWSILFTSLVSGRIHFLSLLRTGQDALFRVLSRERRDISIFVFFRPQSLFRRRIKQSASIIKTEYIHTFLWGFR
jgi:hypothetical protein